MDEFFSKDPTARDVADPFAAPAIPPHQSDCCVRSSPRESLSPRQDSPGRPVSNTLRKRPPRWQTPPGNDNVNVAQHARKCTICRHPERELIEQLFVDWYSIASIRREFRLLHRTVIYRHAQAFGLFERRARNVRFALGAIIENVQSVEPTADACIRAIHAFARINDQGKWVATRTRRPHSDLYDEDSLDPLPISQTSAQPSSHAFSPVLTNSANVSPAASRNSPTGPSSDAKKSSANFKKWPGGMKKSSKISSRFSKRSAGPNLREKPVLIATHAKPKIG
jgi:hypothetical protein